MADGLKIIILFDVGDDSNLFSFSYNFSNLLTAVRRGTAQIAAITYLSDGTKVKVLSEQTIIHHSDLKSVFTGSLEVSITGF